MFGSTVLEVATGMVFVYLLTSLVCSAIGDQISNVLKWRAAELENGIRDVILNGMPQTEVDKFFKNPLVQSLVPKDTGFQKAADRLLFWRKKLPNIPPNIPSQTFALALFDTFVKASPQVNAAGVGGGAASSNQVMSTFEEMRQAVSGMGDSPIKTRIVNLMTGTEAKIANVRTNAEDWFNQAMEQTTEIYKRNMWRLALVIGIIVSVALNADTISIASTLWRDPALRATVTATATQYVATQSTSTPPAQVGETFNAVLDQLNKLNLPVGWQVKNIVPFKNATGQSNSDDVLTSQCVFGYLWASSKQLQCLAPSDWVQTPLNTNINLKILGWILTGLAAAQGAPFWFDLLGRLTPKDNTTTTSKAST